MKFTRVIQDGFSTAEAARLSGLTPRQLDHWDRRGFLRPSLRASGVGLARIRRCVEALERLGENGEADLARARLLVIGNRVLWARSDREVVDLLKEGQLVLVFSLGEAVEETAGAVARFNRDAARAGDPAPERDGRTKQSL